MSPATYAMVQDLREEYARAEVDVALAANELRRQQAWRDELRASLISAGVSVDLPGGVTE